MVQALKVQIIAGALIVVLIFHNLYLKLELEKLIEKSKTRPGSNKESNPVLIYNRVPKTGSTSLMNVAYELYKQNK